MANRILTDPGHKKKIKEELKCSFPTIKTALDGAEVTALHKRIRLRALELGGIEVKPVTVSEETEVVRCGTLSEA